MKRCTKCKKEKLEFEFHLRKASLDGLNSNAKNVLKNKIKNENILNEIGDLNVISECFLEKLKQD